METDGEPTVELSGAIEGLPASLSGTLRLSWGEHQWTADLEFVDNGSQRPHDYDLESNYLRWPLPEGEESYRRIDGARLKRWVDDMTAISRRSRASGTQYWGRIAGTPSDQETEAWIQAEFERLGLENVHSQPFDLAPQWFPTSWEVSIAARGSSEGTHPHLR